MTDSVEPPLRGSAVFVAAVAGALVGAVVIFGDAVDWGGILTSRPWNVRLEWVWNAKRTEFLESGPFVLWAALICAQTAIWAVVLPVLWRIRQGLRHARQGRFVVTAILMWLIVMGGVAGGAFAPAAAHWRSYRYLPDRQWKILLLGGLIALAAVYGLVGIWRIYAELKEKLRQGAVGLRYVDRYLELREKLQLQLVTIGGALGLVILTTGAERNAVQSYGGRFCLSPDVLQRILHESPSCDTHFPAEFVLVQIRTPRRRTADTRLEGVHRAARPWGGSGNLAESPGRLRRPPRPEGRAGVKLPRGPRDPDAARR
jgi:hypothetical protein